MNYLISAILLAAIIVFIIAASNHDIAPFTVLYSHDGDTTKVRDKNGSEFSIRFAVVDANEIKQLGGKEATAYLRSILPDGSKVSLAFTGNESHNRSVATVYYRGENINLAMLKAGHAIIDDRYVRQISKDMQSEYYHAQSEAKRRKLGRWSNPKWCKHTPWEFRASQKR